jgi:plasmid stabilization system protein ParE
LGHRERVANAEATQAVKLTVSGAALADLKRLQAFLADKDIDAARRAVAEIAGTIDALTVFPDRGSPAGMAGLRDLIVPFGRSNYIVRYMHDRAISEIIIIRVWHGREARD